MNFNIKHKQVENPFDNHVQAQFEEGASCTINAKHNSQDTFKNRKCVSPMTFSQKLYQSAAQEIVEEFEQAIEANSLERIKNLLDKVLEIDSGIID